MHVVVPLAGPDFLRPEDGFIKALIPFKGQPLLKHALDSRPWASKVKSYSFVLHDCKEARDFARDYLKTWYKKSSIVYLSNYSRGAAMSTLAGLPMIHEFNQPLIIDLADIIYNSDLSIDFDSHLNQCIAGIALTFESQKPQYSYLRSDKSGKVIEASEKKIISNKASAGTYIYRNPAIFLKAVAHAIEDEPNQTYNDLFYVCPLFNGVIAQGKKVITKSVTNVVDLKNNA
jgi:NDP-sugar pyrophosphorylase family protein